MDFRNAKELLKVCQEQGLSISAVMLQRELTEGEQDPEETDRKMDRVLEIMKSAASTPIHTPVKSMGGLIGGEAKKISDGIAITVFNESLAAIKPAVVMDEKPIYQTGKRGR